MVYVCFQNYFVCKLESFLDENFNFQKENAATKSYKGKFKFLKWFELRLVINLSLFEKVFVKYNTD